MSCHVPDEVLREVPGPEVLQPVVHQVYELPAVAVWLENHVAGLGVEWVPAAIGRRVTSL